MRAFAEHLLELASTDWGPLVMVLHSYLESFILPVAHELFLIPVALARPNLSFVFALMSTVASVCGICTGYFIGKVGGKNILERFFKPKILELAKKEVHKYDVWAVAVACFTPIPVKVFALIAGVLHLNFKKMVFVAFIARGARYFLVSLLLYFYGEPIREWILAYLKWIMIALFVGGVILFFGWKQIEKIILKKEHIE